MRLYLGNSYIHYRLFDLEKNKVVPRLQHVDRLRKAPLGDPQPKLSDILANPDDITSVDESLPKVNAIQQYLDQPKMVAKMLGKKKIQGNWFIRVHYLDFPDSCNEWIPLTELSNESQQLAKVIWKLLPTRGKKVI